MRTILRWPVLCGASAFWFTLALATAVQASRIALPMLCALNALFLALAALGLAFIARRTTRRHSTENVVKQKSNSDWQAMEVNNAIVTDFSDATRSPTSSSANAGLCMWPCMDLGHKLLLISTFVFWVIFAIRLFFTEHFGGSVADFDYGIKPSGERNLTFTLEWESFGHCLQGMASAFLFPAFIAMCAKYVCVCGGERGTKIAFSILYAVPIILVFYPTYNLIKRVIKSRTQFAISSYANNGAEWASGAMLGICIGLCATVLAAHLGVVPRDGEQKGKLLATPIDKVRRTLKICTVVAGAILNLSAVFCLAFFIASWNNTTVEDEE